MGFLSKLFGKVRIGIEINKLYYFLEKSNSKHPIVVESAMFPSAYQALVGVYNGGNKSFLLKEVRLKIGSLDIKCVNHTLLEIRPTEYKQFLWIFPIEVQKSKKQGRFTLSLIDISNNIYERSGRFPIYGSEVLKP